MANYSFRITLLLWQIARAFRPGGFSTRVKLANTILLLPALLNEQMKCTFWKKVILKQIKTLKTKRYWIWLLKCWRKSTCNCSWLFYIWWAYICRPATGHKENTKLLCNWKKRCAIFILWRKRTIYCASCTISYATAAAAFCWFTFLTTVWLLKSAVKTCNTLLMMINISKIFRCFLWLFLATIKRIVWLKLAA